MIKNIFFIFLFCFSLINNSISAKSEVFDRIIMIIDQDVVMLSELKMKAQENFNFLRQKNTQPMPSEDKILNRSLNQLIEEKLLLAEASRQGISADEESVSKAIQKIAKSNNLSVPNLKKTLISEGRNFKNFQQSIYNQIVIQKILNKEVINKINVSESEIDQYLNLQNSAPSSRQLVKLLHILIKVPNNSSPQKIKKLFKKASSTRLKINNGENFKELAQKVSDGERAINGGDLGWLKIASLPSGFGDLVKKMKINEVKGPFRSQDGFHIIKVKNFKKNELKRSIVERTKASHILIRTDEVTSNDEAKIRLNKLRERILNGDNFSSLASANSNDQASAINGGSLGWITPGQMVPEFEKILNNIKIGQLSEPFKTRFGWHIVFVQDREKHDVTKTIQKDIARKAIRQKKIGEAQRQYKRRLRGEAYIEMRLNEIL